MHSLHNSLTSFFQCRRLVKLNVVPSDNFSLATYSAHELKSETQAATCELEPRKPWTFKSWGVRDFLAHQEGLLPAPGLAYPPDPREAPAGKALARSGRSPRLAAPPARRAPRPRPSPTRPHPNPRPPGCRRPTRGARRVPTATEISECPFFPPFCFFLSPGTLRLPTPGLSLTSVGSAGLPRWLVRPRAPGRARSRKGVWVRARSGLRQRKGRDLWGVT